MGTLRILSQAGDEEITWDAEDEAATAKAKEKFDGLVKKGYLAYKVVTDTMRKKGEQIKEFDPSMGEVIMQPQMSGG